jgi:hypothetical protein
VGKTFSKYRQDRDSFDDECVYQKRDEKKKKKQNAELRKMRGRQYESESFGYEEKSKPMRYR